MTRLEQAPAPTFAQSTALVASREIRMRLRSKAFLVSTGILLLGVLASIVLGNVFNSASSAPEVAMQRSVVNGLPDMLPFEQTLVSTREEAIALVRDGEVDAAVVQGSEVSELGVTVIGLDEAPTSVAAAISTAPDIEVLEPAKTDSALAYIVALGFGLVFFVSATTFGSTIAQSVVEEKQTRVVELLMAAIPVRALLAGKVIGNSVLAFAQITAIALITAVGLVISNQGDYLALLGPSIGWFVVFFVFGFVLLAALFAAAASLVSRQEDVGSVTGPVMMLVMIPYFAVVFAGDNDLVVAIMSYVPFSAAIGMPLRVFLGTAAWWEPLVSLVILLLATAAVIVIGSRIYGNSLLRTGGRVRLKEALRG
jgi:ABC-2 type transport system permease protein